MNNKKLKYMAVMLTLFAIVMVFTTRVILDHNAKFGFSIVSIDDYKKQKEGYCLKEDRILSEDEIYRRAVKSYLLTIREEAEYPKYYNYMDEKYSYWDICTGGHCNFYKFDVKNLDELNKFITPDIKIEVDKLIRNYGVKFEPKNSDLFDGDGNFMHTLVFDNIKNIRLEFYFPNAFSITTQDEVKKNKALLSKYKKISIPTNLEYSKYYLAIRYFLNYGHRIDNFNESDDIYYYIPITTCGEIKFSDIFDKPGGRKYIFSASDNIFDR